MVAALLFLHGHGLTVRRGRIEVRPVDFEPLPPLAEALWLVLGAVAAALLGWAALAVSFAA